MGFLVAYMAYYMVTIRERCDEINNNKGYDNEM